MRYGPWPRRGRLLRHLCFSSSFLRFPNPGGWGHVQGARAHRAERGLPLTWPRQDYIARLEEEEKRRSNRQPRTAARGRPRPWPPPPRLAVRGQEHASATSARQHTARPVKDHLTYSGAQRPPRGGGARCHHTVHLPPPAPRQARACAACPRHAQGLRPRSASTEVRLTRPHALAGGQTAVAVLLVRAARPGLDAGALWQYIAKSCKEGGKPAEG
jgi:hypothetical protein